MNFNPRSIPYSCQWCDSFLIIETCLVENKNGKCDAVCTKCFNALKRLRAKRQFKKHGIFRAFLNKKIEKNKKESKIMYEVLGEIKKKSPEMNLLVDIALGNLF